MEVVRTWTGREADALRQALRMTNEAFASHLGVAVRTVADWRKRPDMIPRPAMQETLDAALERAAERAKYYSRGFPVCVRAAALRDAMLMAAGYMLSSPSGRRLSGGCLEEPGAVVVPAGGGLVASPPQRPAQGGREPGAGEQPGGGLPGQCGEPGGLGDR